MHHTSLVMPDLECEESAMTNEIEAELMTSWEGGAAGFFMNKLGVFVRRSGFLDQ